MFKPVRLTTTTGFPNTSTYIGVFGERRAERAEGMALFHGQNEAQLITHC